MRAGYEHVTTPAIRDKIESWTNDQQLQGLELLIADGLSDKATHLRQALALYLRHCGIARHRDRHRTASINLLPERRTMAYSHKDVLIAEVKSSKPNAGGAGRIRACEGLGGR